MPQINTTSENIDPTQLLQYQNLLNTNQATYPTLGIPNYAGLMKTQSGNIASLLNPTDFSDQQRQGAEMAVGSGTAGSQFSENNTLKLTEDERLRRQQLGSQILNSATASLPPPVNPAALLGHTSTSNTGVPGVATSYPQIGGYSPAPGRVGPLPGDIGNIPQVGTGQEKFFQYGTNPSRGGGTMDFPNQLIGNYAPGSVNGTNWDTEGGAAVDEYGEPIDYSPVFSGDEAY